MKLVCALVALFALGAVGCGSSSKSTDAKPTTCTEGNARALSQDFISGSKFDVDCVKVAAGATFYFVNNDEAAHTVTTIDNAPESFDADLPNKNSTYSHVFKTKGTYRVQCKRHQEQMTLIVT